MKKRYTKKQITEAIKFWKRQLKKLDENVDKDRKQDLDGFADMVYSFIKNAVKQGSWAPEYEGEQPTRERIEASLPWELLGDPTAEEKNYVMDKVYPKLRKNSVFAKMKKAMRGEED